MKYLIISIGLVLSLTAFSQNDIDIWTTTDTISTSVYEFQVPTVWRNLSEMLSEGKGPEQYFEASGKGLPVSFNDGPVQVTVFLVKLDAPSLKDAKNEIIATTNSNWKAQTFYTAPLKDLSCATEKGALRLSENCNTEDSDDGTTYYALHWKTPLNWQAAAFDDSEWPNATEFSNQTIGVDNKHSYTNFTDIFDNPANDAKFIWSTNVILDNEVIVRYTVK